MTLEMIERILDAVSESTGYASVTFSRHKPKVTPPTYAVSIATGSSEGVPAVVVASPQHDNVEEAAAMCVMQASKVFGAIGCSVGLDWSK